MHPIQEPRNSGLLRVSDIHEIYWEESGNPDGHPVIFLHGGPGAGASPACRGFFNPEHFRIVIIDQRGCGRSKPYACIEDNTTWDLVADIEKVREMLGIQKWLVFGGSWGSTLSLTYAETHPDRVSGLRQALIKAYHEMLFSEDEATRLKAAKSWADWESYLIQFEPKDVDEDPQASLAIARMENHYFVNEGWLQGDKAILANIGKIRHIPTIIVQGRYDLCTPMQSAWELSQAFPEAELRIVQAGHSSFDPSLSEALVKAVEDIRSKL